METLRTEPETLSGGDYFPGVRYTGGGSIAVRMPNWLGDAVMALPALRQLRLGGYGRIAAVAPPGVAALLDLFDCVDETVVLPEAHCGWPEEAVSHLRDLGADCGLLFTNSPRDAVYFRRAGIRRVFGAAARGRSLFLEGAFKFPWNRRGEVGKLHHARKYSLMAEAVGGSAWDGRFPECRLSGGTPFGLSGAPLLVLAPGAAYGAAKRWPSNGFANTGKRFLADCRNGQVAIVGAPGERAIADEVAGLLGENSRVINLCGKTTLAELAEILKASSACVANDSGTMHLSAAVGGSGVAVFGSTDWAVTSPLSTRWRIVHSKWGCAPCFRRSCELADEPLCMRSINSEYVYRELKELLPQG